MTTALLVQPTDEVTVFRVPRGWRLLPKDWQQDLGFWYVIRSLQMQEGVIMSGPPRDFEWTFADKPEQVRAVVLKHDCDDCQQAREAAAQLLEADPNETIAFVQFVQDYVFAPGEQRTGFEAVGSLHRKVDVEP